MSRNNMVPKTFWAVGVGLLLWNIIGDVAYLTQVTADLDALARTDPVTARAFASMPSWAWGVYATGVWSGTLASILLLMRRKWALWAFVLSLAAVVVQFGRTFLATDLIAEKGVSSAIFPMVIFAIGLFCIWWTRACDGRGWLR